MGLINTASAWPGDDMNPDTIEADAKKLATMGTSVARHGASIATTWHGLKTSYEAPEDEELFSAINPVKKDAESFHTEMYWVANALTQFAHEVRVIKQQVAQIRVRATTFLAGITNGQVTPKSSGYNPYGGGTLSDPKLVAWADDDTTRNANNALIAEVDHWAEVLAAAEASCASSIASQTPGAGGSTNQPPKGSGSWYGWSASSTQPKPMPAEPSPWGEPTTKPENAWDTALDLAGGMAKAVVVHEIWRGELRNVLLPTLESLANPLQLRALGLSMFDPKTLLPGPGASALHPMQAWKEQYATAKQFMTEPSLEFTALTVIAAWRVGGFAAARKIFAQKHPFETNLVKGFTDWDDRYRDPLAMVGTIQANVALLVAPGGVAKLAKIGGAAGEAGAVEAEAGTAEAGAAARAGEASAAAKAGESLGAAQSEAVAETMGDITAHDLGGGSFGKFIGGAEEGLITEAYPNGIPGIEIGETAGRLATAAAPEFADLAKALPADATDAPFRLTTDIKIDPPPTVADTGINMGHSHIEHGTEANASHAPSSRPLPEPARTSSTAGETTHAGSNTELAHEREPALAGSGGRGGHSADSASGGGHVTESSPRPHEPAGDNPSPDHSSGDDRQRPSEDPGNSQHDDIGHNDETNKHHDVTAGHPHPSNIDGFMNPNAWLGNLYDDLSSSETHIANQARAMYDSPALNEIRAAHAAGKPTEVLINNMPVLYEPEMPSSGFTLFEEHGFVIGPEAFKSESELARTLAHETYRLGTSQAAGGVSADLAATETRDAAAFAEKIGDCIMEDR